MLKNLPRVTNPDHEWPHAIQSLISRWSAAVKSRKNVLRSWLHAELRGYFAGSEAVVIHSRCDRDAFAMQPPIYSCYRSGYPPCTVYSNTVHSPLLDTINELDSFSNSVPFSPSVTFVQNPLTPNENILSNAPQLPHNNPNDINSTPSLNNRTETHTSTTPSTPILEESFQNNNTHPSAPPLSQIYAIGNNFGTLQIADRDDKQSWMMLHCLLTIWDEGEGND